LHTIVVSMGVRYQQQATQTTLLTTLTDQGKMRNELQAEQTSKLTELVTLGGTLLSPDGPVIHLKNEAVGELKNTMSENLTTTTEWHRRIEERLGKIEAKLDADSQADAELRTELHDVLVELRQRVTPPADKPAT